MNILFTICGRAGSKGFKNKNLKEMNGVPLVYYTLAAIKCFMDAHPEHECTISLNTDSEELKDTITKQSIIKKIEIIDRKEELAGDEVPKVDVIKNIFMMLKKGDGYDVIIDLDITSPLRRLCDIENVLREYMNNTEYDIVFSVVNSRRSPYFNMIEKKPDGSFRKVCESRYTVRQQVPKCYELNASIYAYRPSFLMSNIDKPILDYCCGISLMPDFLVLDIDSEEDFVMMSRLHKMYCELDDGVDGIYSCSRLFKR